MKDGKSVFVVLALTVFIVYVMRNFLGKLSAFFFIPIDNLLFISHSLPPVVMWMIFGLLIGLVYGSFISIKKYKLDYKLLVYPGLALLIGMSLILLASFVVQKVKGEPVSGSTGDEPGREGKGSYLTAANRVKLNKILEKGILAVENERYESAEELFIKAASLGKGDSRLDSLAKVYTHTGNDKCTLFNRDSQLKYIPNYYYKYAAALTNKPPEVCK